LRLAAEYFETNSSSDVVAGRVDAAGWYVVYSSVRWQSCVTSWRHGVYVDQELIANSHGNDDAAGGSCRTTSHLVVTSFLRDVVRATASAETDRTEITIKLQRLS